MTPAEVTESLGLNKLKDRIWYVVPSCATTGEGIFEGLVSRPSLVLCMVANAVSYQGWLSNNVKAPPPKQVAS